MLCEAAAAWALDVALGGLALANGALVGDIKDTVRKVAVRF